MSGMHMPNIPNQGMMNMTPMQQQIMQQQQQVQQQQPPNIQQQQMMHQQQQQMQQQPVPNLQQQAGPGGAPATQNADQNKVDHIGKVKTLLYPLKESLANCFRTGAQNFYQNGMIDFGTLKGTDIKVPCFDKQLEEFYSICDQIELNLQAAITCSTQMNSSHRHIPTPVSVVRQEQHIPPNPQQPEFLTYATYIDVSKNQVAYVKDVMDALNDAAQNLSSD